jgi:hypothetical protein
MSAHHKLKNFHAQAADHALLTRRVAQSAADRSVVLRHTAPHCSRFITPLRLRSGYSAPHCSSVRRGIALLTAVIAASPQVICDRSCRIICARTAGHARTAVASRSSALTLCSLRYTARLLMFSCCVRICAAHAPHQTAGSSAQAILCTLRDRSADHCASGCRRTALACARTAVALRPRRSLRSFCSLSRPLLTLRSLLRSGWDRS